MEAKLQLHHATGHDRASDVVLSDHEQPRRFSDEVLLGTLNSATPALGPSVPQARQRGWDEMCQRNDQPLDFCSPHSGPEVIRFSPELREVLHTVNIQISGSYRYRSDSAERWTVPRGNTADCEDYVLAKITALDSVGIPVSAMSIAVGRMWNGRWHAVLVIATDAGPIALDNTRRQLIAPQQVGMEEGYAMSTPGHWVAFP